MKILAIETSCDETAVAVLEIQGTRKAPKFRVLSNVVASQVAIHAPFGGVVPNLAKREHQKNLVPVLMTALQQAGLLKKRSTSIRESIEVIEKIFEREPELFKIFKKEILKIKIPEIDVIAVTRGPGLAPALWTGVNFAKALSFVWEKPLISVNHLAGHIYVNLIRGRQIHFPALALIVSGGHTKLVLMKRHNNYKIIGETRDDAAGEAFDKVARLMNLGYPGGPLISALAEKAARDKRQETRIILPRPMIHSNDFDFSFSGLKTAVLYWIKEQKRKLTKEQKIASAKEFQNAVVEVLIQKTVRAAKMYKVKTVILGGGVAANKKLRRNLFETLKKECPHTELLLPEISETTDNALMIAAAAFFGHKKMRPAEALKLRADPGLRLGKSR